MKTRQVLERVKPLGVSLTRIRGLIAADRFAPPGKDVSGDYIWTEADVQRLLEVARVDGRKAKAALASPCGVA